MKIRTFATITATLLLSSAGCVSANAQTLDTPQATYNRPWSVSLGQLTTQSQVVDSAERTHTTLSIAYNLKRGRLSSRSLEPYLDVFLRAQRGVIDRDSFDTLTNQRYTTSGFGIGISAIGYNKKRGFIADLYTGMGAGLYYTDTDVNVAIEQNYYPNPPVRFTQSRSRRLISLGSKLMAGLALRNGIFAELSLQLPNLPLSTVSQYGEGGNVGGNYADSLRGIGYRLGYRF